MRKKKDKDVKLEKVELTLQEWYNSLRVPSPIRNKKKYQRKEKYPRKDLED
tara:strand:- start:791 stop:943 length:153 start_codon:yes stop_codon:yes gene_type:complete